MSARLVRLSVCAALAVVLLAGVAHINAASSNGRDWPQFRGVNRDGISTETGLLTSWPESGPKESRVGNKRRRWTLGVCGW